MWRAQTSVSHIPLIVSSNIGQAQDNLNNISGNGCLGAKWIVEQGVVLTAQKAAQLDRIQLHVHTNQLFRPVPK